MVMDAEGPTPEGNGRATSHVQDPWGNVASSMTRGSGINRTRGNETTFMKGPWKDHVVMDAEGSTPEWIVASNSTDGAARGLMDPGDKIEGCIVAFRRTREGLTYVAILNSRMQTM